MFSKQSYRSYIGFSLTVVLVLALSLPAMACPQAGSPVKPDNTPNTKTRCECPCEGDAGSGTGCGGSRSGPNAEPADRAAGDVTMRQTDVALPASSPSWLQVRGYSSSLAGGTYIQGTKWRADVLTAFLAPGDSGSVELYRSHVSKRVFTFSGGSYMPPDDFHANLTHDTGNKVFLLKMTDSGEQFMFRDFDASWPANSRGIIQSQTDRNGQESIQYLYDTAAPGGRITSVTTAQGWTVDYGYVPSGTNVGQIDTIEVHNGAGQVIQRVRYTYYKDGGGYSTDCGSNGDLIMVQTFRRGTGDDLNQSSDAHFSVQRTTMYRYYRDGSADGAAGQLKMQINPAAVAKAMADGDKTAGELLATADSGIVTGSTTLGDYAAATYRYYTSNLDTTDVDTAEGGVGGDNEDLQDAYGGTNVDETGYLRSETIRSVTAGALGTRTYFYMDKYDPATSGPNAVTRILVEDTADDGTRRITAVNKDRIPLRQITVDDPDGATPKYWCSSSVLGETKDTSTNDVNQVVESRPPSAHTCIDSLAKVRTFLAAKTATDWTNTDILNASAGRISLYAYNAQGYQIEERIKQGRTGDAYYLHVTEYGDGSANQPTYLPVTDYAYPVETTSKTDASRLTTSYAYTFWDTAGNSNQQLKTRTTTYPIVTTDRNGPGTAVTGAEYYDDSGHLRWTQDGDGHVNYYAHNAHTGGTGYMMVDVKTDSLPAHITNGSDPDWVAWSGTPPFSYTAGDALQLVSKYTYDDQGRQVSVQDPEGLVTATAYGDNQTRVYPAWDATNHTCALPIEISKTDDDGRTTDAYSVDPTGVTIGTSGSLPTGSDGGETQDDYTAWTRYAYNAVSGMLEITDRYHTIPSSGFGSLGANFQRTFYRYDSLGRTIRTIGVVSGTDAAGLTGCVEQVTRTDYDSLGRVKAVYRGVSSASHVMKTTTIYDTDPTMYKVAENFYDETSPGSGTEAVGDGNLTASRTYFDSGANDYLTELNQYDWRDRLEQTRVPGDITARYTYCNLDRLLKTETYADADEDWTIDGGGNYELRAVQETSYDQQGRTCRQSTYDVTSDAPTVKLTTNYWYGARGNQVKTKDPAGLFSKIVYDGAGRAVADYVCYDPDEADTDYAQALTVDAVGGSGADTVVNVTASVYDSDGRVTQVKRGTSLANAVTVRKDWYDTACDGSGTQRPYLTGTSVLKATDSTSAFALTTYEYDRAGRQSAAVLPDPDGAGDLVQTKSEQTFDALGRVLTATTSKKDGANWDLLTRSETLYGDSIYPTTSRTYKADTSVYLQTAYDYDGYGQLRRTTGPNGAFTKAVYNDYGRLTGSYVGTDEGDTDDPLSVTDDTVVQQTVPSYDPATGRVWMTASYQRNDGAAGTGALTPSNARVSYAVTWFDDVGRVKWAADYGTNGGTAITSRSYDFDGAGAGSDYATAAMAAGTSDYILTALQYDGYGRNDRVTDNKGHKTRTFYDTKGRRTHVAENWDDFAATDGGSESGSGDATDTSKDRVTKYVYNDAGQVTQLIAFDPNGDGNSADNQVTRYVYAAELTDKGCPVPDNARLRGVIYPDSADTVTSNAMTGADHVEVTYYADGSAATRTDQRGVEHTYAYDDLARPLTDALTAVPANDVHFDGAIRRIGRTYDQLGRLASVSSYDAATGGNVKNQVAFAYDDWGPVMTSWQAHAGSAVISGGSQSPHVDYAYADGASGDMASYLRLSSVTYPGPSTQRAVYYNYPASGSIGGRLNRLDNIATSASPSSSDKYASYTYLGASAIVQVAHPAVTNGLTLTYGSGGSYTGLDRFGRVIDQTWRDTQGTPVTKDRFRYGYDAASNRVWKENKLASDSSKALDEFYLYDGLDRLADSKRGHLAGTYPSYTGIANTPADQQTWTLDQLGNWGGLVVKATGATTLDQSRTNNPVNEITDIAGNNGTPTWVTPAYDAAGNMTYGPKPGDEATATSALLCVWDGWNRLVKVYKDDGTGDGNAGALVTDPDEGQTADSLVAEYQYDGRGYRIAKIVPNGEDWDRTDYYYNESWQCLEERFAAATADKTAVATAPKVQWLWDIRYIDAPVCRWRDEDDDGDFTDSGEELYYCNHANMNVSALVNASGSVVERYVYGPYGRTTIYDGTWTNTRSTSNYHNEILYCGYRFDPETGLNYVRARYYAVSLGSWINRDPLGYISGSDLYQYVRSRPTTAIDPLGLNDDSLEARVKAATRELARDIRNQLFDYINAAAKTDRQFGLETQPNRLKALQDVYKTLFAGGALATESLPPDIWTEAMHIYADARSNAPASMPYVDNTVLLAELQPSFKYISQSIARMMKDRCYDKEGRLRVIGGDIAKTKSGECCTKSDCSVWVWRRPGYLGLTNKDAKCRLSGHSIIEVQGRKGAYAAIDAAPAGIGWVGLLGNVKGQVRFRTAPLWQDKPQGGPGTDYVEQHGFVKIPCQVADAAGEAWNRVLKKCEPGPLMSSFFRDCRWYARDMFVHLTKVSLELEVSPCNADQIKQAPSTVPEGGFL
ncbi:MAG: hypothetical protein BIFFINMI_03291 [Phycisphaerae bacterium]|nr:hypothetical protein [Phycisphaerae bacterium]